MAPADEQVVQALRASLKETERLRRQNRQLLAASREPIAIVGMSCRYPGPARSPEELWRARARGRRRDLGRSLPIAAGISSGCTTPTRSAPDAAMCARAGSCTTSASSTRSSSGSARARRWRWIPQQRLLLEASWEAFEDAGIDPRSLRGSHDRGVRRRDVPGLRRGSADRGRRLDVRGLPAADRQRQQRASRAGSRTRFGLEGPAVTVDTACSSSLVALHLACQALRGGECSLALAGGVTVMSTPERVRRVQPAARPRAGRAVQVVRGRPPTGRAGPRASACCCWSGCPTRSATATGCWRWCAAARSTRTAPATA